MRLRITPSLLTAVAVSLLLLLALASTAAAAPTTLMATLTGSAEVPSGDPDGSGTATVTLDPATGQVCWNISVSAIMPATASHIHTGAAGTAGPVLINLDVDGFTGTTEGCTSNVPAADINSVLANPAGFYVNVHTSDFPGGAVRGQLAAQTPNTAVESGAPAAPSLGMLGALLVALAAATLVPTIVTTRR